MISHLVCYNPTPKVLCTRSTEKLLKNLGVLRIKKLLGKIIHDDNFLFHAAVQHFKKCSIRESIYLSQVNNGSKRKNSMEYV